MKDLLKEFFSAKQVARMGGPTLALSGILALAYTFVSPIIVPEKNVSENQQIENSSGDSLEFRRSDRFGNSRDYQNRGGYGRNGYDQLQEATNDDFRQFSSIGGKIAASNKANSVAISAPSAVGLIAAANLSGFGTKNVKVGGSGSRGKNSRSALRKVNSRSPSSNSPQGANANLLASNANSGGLGSDSSTGVSTPSGGGDSYSPGSLDPGSGSGADTFGGDSGGLSGSSGGFVTDSGGDFGSSGSSGSDGGSGSSSSGSGGSGSDGGLEGNSGSSDSDSSGTGAVGGGGALPAPINSSTGTGTGTGGDSSDDGSSDGTGGSSGSSTGGGSGSPVNPSPGFGPASQIVILDPSDSYINVPTNVTVQIQDEDGNKVTSFNDDVTLNVDLNGVIDGSGASVLLDIVSGEAIASLNDAVSETVTLTLTDTASTGLTITSSQTVNFTLPPSQVVFVQQPTDVNSGSSINPAITVEIRDALNALVPVNDAVSLIFDNDPTGTATLTGTTTVNAVNGVATFSDISVDKIGANFRLRALSTGLTAANSNNFTVNPGADAKLAFTVQPSTTQSRTDITAAITVRILDANDNLTNSTASVTLAIANDPSVGGTLFGTTEQAAVAGTATFNDIEIDKIGTGYTLQATSTGLTPDTSSSFNITLGPLAQVAFVQQPTTTVFNTTFSPAITVALQDAGGNQVNSTDNVTLTFQTDPSGSATFGGASTVAAVAGLATFSTLTIDNTSAGYILRASSGGAATDDSSSFTIASGAPTQLVFNQQPTHTVSEQIITPSLTVEIQDAGGNLASTDTRTVTLSFETDSSSGTATIGGTTSVAAVGGVATFSNITIDKAYNAYELRASATGVASVSSNAFNITPGAPAKLAFLTDPSNAGAGSVISPNIEVQILDNADNLTSSTATIDLGFGTDPSAGTASIGGTVSVAAIAGTATFNDITVDKPFTGYTLTATSTGLTADTSGSFDIAVGSPAQLAFIQNPTDTPLADTISPNITVEIQDAGGNKTNSTANVTLSILTDPSSGAATLGGTVTVAAINGEATFNDLWLDKRFNNYILQATGTGVASAGSNSFNITTGVPYKLGFGTQPNDGPQLTDMDPFTVEIQDYDGNVTASTGNITLSFETDPTSGTASYTGTITVAAVAGTAIFNDIQIDTIDTGYAFRATGTGVASASSNAFNIVSLGPELVFNASPTNALPFYEISPSITVELQNGAGAINTGATDNVTLAIVTDPSGGTATLNGYVTVQAVNGVATFNDIFIDTVADGYQLIATATGYASATSQLFNIENPDGQPCDNAGSPGKLVMVKTAGSFGAPAVGDLWCVDLYENILYKDMDVTGTYTASDVLYGQGVDDIPDADIDNTSPGTEDDEQDARYSQGQFGQRILAAAVAGVSPSQYVSYHQARKACRARSDGSVLVPANVWIDAASLTPEGVSTISPNCITGGAAPGVAGAQTSCVSQSGHHDMVGSLKEWVDGNSGNAMARCGVGSGNNCSLAGAAFPDTRGGDFDDGAGALIASVAGESAGDQVANIGFRCARQHRGPIKIYDIADINNKIKGTSGMGRKFVLQNDLDLSSGWTEITQEFMGTFDGNGYTIRGLNTVGTNFFQSLSGVLKNVNFEDNVATAVYGGHQSCTGRMENVHVRSDRVTDYAGVIDNVCGMQFYNVSFVGTVNNPSSNVGGIVRSIQYGAMAKVYAEGTVYGSSYGTALLAGNFNYSSLRECYAKGTVEHSGSGFYAGMVSGQDYLNSYDDCYAEGTLNTNSNQPTYNSPFGRTNSGQVTNVYARVNYRKSPISPVVGQQVSSGTVTNVYWDKDFSFIGSPGYGATGLTSVEMASQTSFANWNFVDTWFPPNEYFGPTLRGFGPKIQSTLDEVIIIEGDTKGVTIALNTTLPENVTFDYATVDGTATQADSDYTVTTGSGTITSGNLTTTINLPTIPDATDEGEEQYYLVITNIQPASVTMSNASITISIANDDDVNIGTACDLNNNEGIVVFNTTDNSKSPLRLGSLWCVDKYENIAFKDNDADGAYTASVDTLYGQASDDIDSSLGNSVPNIIPAYYSGANHRKGVRFVGLSVSGEQPSRYVSYFQAIKLCAARMDGSVLLPEDIYRSAVTGTPSGVSSTSPSCITNAAGPGIAGSQTSCVSSTGIHDLVGNLAEWVDGNIEDENLPCYRAETSNNCPTGTGTSNPATRGGDFDDAAAAEDNYRNGFEPNSKNINVGFRCARPFFAPININSLADMTTHMTDNTDAGKVFKLTTNLNASGFVGVSNFRGTFDGQGYTISNIDHNNGLFNNISGVFKNLVLDNISTSFVNQISSTDYYGRFVNIHGNGNANGSAVGPIARYCYGCSFSNVGFVGTVSGNSNRGGGLVGMGETTHFSNVYFIGRITNTYSGTSQGTLGGISGISEYGSGTWTANNCYVDAIFDVPSPYIQKGGVFGNGFSSEIENCVVNANPINGTLLYAFSQYNPAPGTIVNSYYNASYPVLPNSAGETGFVGDGLYTQGNYSGLDFTYFFNSPTSSTLPSLKNTPAYLRFKDYPVYLKEGDGSNQTVDVIIGLNKALPGNVTFDYATSDDSATAGVDYTAVSGSAIIVAGTYTATITISSLADFTDDGHLVLNLNLSNISSNAIAPLTSVEVHVRDDDSALDGQPCSQLGNDGVITQVKTIGAGSEAIYGSLWCVDKYENIVFWDHMGNRKYDLQETTFGISSNDWHADFLAESAGGLINELRGIGSKIGSVPWVSASVPGVTPSGYISYHQARKACINRGNGSILVPENLWVDAMAGTPESVSTTSPDCVTSGGSKGVTGAQTSCTSSSGIHDGVGSLAEWVDGNYGSEFSACGSGSGANCSGGNRPAIRGGHYGSGAAADLSIRQVQDASLTGNAQVGFRCAHRYYPIVEINSAADLMAIDDNYGFPTHDLSREYVLKTDLNLSSGYTYPRFRGIFYGNGHTITDLPQYMFSPAEGGRIQDLNFTWSNGSGAPFNGSWTFGSSDLENITMSGTLNAPMAWSMPYSSIYHVNRTATYPNATSTYGSTIISQGSWSNYWNIHSNVSMTGGWAGGGLVGQFYDSSIFHSSYTGNYNNTSNYAGGLVGYHHTKGYFWDNFVNGDVTNSSNNLGGIIGYSTATEIHLKNMYYTGNFTNGSAPSSCISGNSFAVTSASGIYYNTTGTGCSAGYNGTASNTTDMQDAANYLTNYTAWDFNEIWYPPTGSTFPTLREYGTFNPGTKHANAVLSNLDLTATITGGGGVRGIQPRIHGKYYFEFTIDSLTGTAAIGVSNDSAAVDYDHIDGTDGWGTTNGTATDIVGVAIDLNTGEAWFAVNNVWEGGGDPAAGTNPAATNLRTGSGIAPAASCSSNCAITVNLGQSAMNYTPPEGFIPAFGY